MKTLSVWALMAVLRLPSLALAGPTATAVTTEIATWYATDGFITLVGSALALAAIFAVGYKWLKGMIFS